jgi:hypothetical protein
MDPRRKTSPALDEIARKFGTDKSSLLNALTEKYEMYLEPRRHERLTLLEIGIYQGASLRMWHEYLPEATIAGADVVVDDGSHVCSHQITTFKTLYPYLKPGGIFFVEDVTTNYREEYGGGLGRPDTFLRFAQDLVPFIPMSMGCVAARHPWEADLDFIHFSGYGGLIAIGKLSSARKAKILGHAG